ncbi:MAG: methylmalonyl-CoA epimerase [Acidobacteria bacterium]|nr:methylmalonyl-CoA epimerase [Acidobacteriota bacterium]
MKLDHLGVAVRSVDQALELYRDGLGLAVRHRGVVEHEGVEVAMLPAGDARIELLEPTTPDSAIARFLEKRGEGLHHIALEVDDLEAAVGRLRGQGRRLVTEEIQIGAEGYRYVFVHPSSAGGVLLELIER